MYLISSEEFLRVFPKNETEKICFKGGINTSLDAESSGGIFWSNSNQQYKHLNSIGRRESSYKG